MIYKKYLSIFLFPVAIFFSLQAHAELGDYSFFDILGNIFSPRKADNPVTASQANAAKYPLIVNPSGFKDGFSPSKYMSWQTITLHPSTGAICGNGSPYKIFVNRVAETSNTLIYFEGGGACWDYESCSGKTGIRGARNPEGIPDNYMGLLNPTASLVTPFIFRSHPWTSVKTQKWNLVYVPYCTGDTYAGDKVAVYTDPSNSANQLVWHHNGMKNSRAVVGWVKNNLQRPAQLMTTGCSAGGVGSLVNYHPLRRDIAPTKSYMFNDSGPIYWTPPNGNPTDYPSVYMHQKIINSWGLQDSGVLSYLGDGLPGTDMSNLGNINAGLANRYKDDRFGHAQFWDDLNYSSYSYERFHPGISTAPQNQKSAKLHELWYKDTQALQSLLNSYSNYGYYVPRYRAVNESHCTSIIEFANADIQEKGLQLDDFVKSVMEGTGAVMKASETNTVADYQKPASFLYQLIDSLMK